MTDDDLTRLLAERVMGWIIGGGTCEDDYSTTHIYYDGDGGYWRGAGSNLSYGPMRQWRPLESMDDAWMVAEHLRTRTTGPRYWCEIRTPWMDGELYQAGFTAWEFTGWNGKPDFSALAPTPQRAICLAVVLVKKEKK